MFGGSLASGWDGVGGIQGYLPAEPDRFIGRERELDELRRLMSSGRVLTLSGPGGVGKTRLALRLLASIADGFPAGLWFVGLADLRQPELVVSRVAEVIGVSEEPGRPLLETLTDALRSRHLLLALDNCEHVIGACAVLTRRLLAGAPGLKVLATSREPLRVAGETVWEVPPLSVAPPGAGSAARLAVGDAAPGEAVRLFADRAARWRPGFTVGPGNIDAIVSVCRALDGLPLAIELAAAQAGTLSLDQIRARLEDRLALLTGNDRSVLPRQRTLRAAIEWSYELLTVAERVLFGRLSVFAGWSLDMAEQVCSGPDLPASDLPGLLAALVDKSLVVAEPEMLGQRRYRMLGTIRKYAEDCLAEAGEAAAFQLQLRDYVLATAEHSLAVGMAGDLVPWPTRIDCSRRYDIESGNVSQVLGWCLARHEAEIGLRVCIAVSPRWMVWGTFAEGGERVDSFLGLDTSSVARRIRGAALVVRAQLALPSDRAAAESWAQEGLALCRDAGDPLWTAGALNLLSEIALSTGRMDGAAAFADEALAIAQATGDGWNKGYALGTRAAIAARAGRPHEARQLAGASVTVMRGIDQQWGAARALLGLGDLARLQGHPGEAHSRYFEALTILRQVGARPEIARCLLGLGRVAMELGSTGQARRHLTRSLQLSQATGTRVGVARGLEAFAALAVHEDLPEQAVQLAAAATALRRTAGQPPLPDSRIETYLTAARRLGGSAIDRLWAKGLAMSGDEAVALALEPPNPAPAEGSSPLTVIAMTSPAPAAADKLPKGPIAD